MPPVSCGKKPFPFLRLWRCWAAHYSCGYFNVWKHWKNAHTGHLFDHTLCETRPRKTLCQAEILAKQNFKSFLSSSELYFNLFRQLSQQRKRRAWLSEMMRRNGICESRCLTWARSQTGFVDGYLFLTICHLQECASRCSCLLNQFPMQNTLISKEFSKHQLEPKSSIISESSSCFLIKLYNTPPSIETLVKYS